MTIVEVVAWLVVAVLLVPLATLSFELGLALLPSRRCKTDGNRRPRAAVLVPAHNEEGGIALTLSRIIPQLHAGDRLLVVADNCSDATARVAREAGAEALERFDPDRRGKGYALDFGLKALAADPPDVVIVIDADTEVLPGAVDALAAAAVERPAQSVNLLDAPPDSGPGARISAFAFLIKNYVRPRGLDRLGLPCLLYGTGMAIPYRSLVNADLAHGDITEDMRLGLDLAIAGTPPAFCPEANVRGVLPTADSAVNSQRRRWEHGHIRTLIRQVPRLLAAGIIKRRPELVALALHVGVPPLSLLVLAAATAIVALSLSGFITPAITLAVGLAGTGTSVFAAWFRFGRDRLSVADLILAPVYAARKIPLYVAYLARPQRAWVRTGRQQESNATARTGL